MVRYPKRQISLLLLIPLPLFALFLFSHFNATSPPLLSPTRNSDFIHCSSPQQTLSSSFTLIIKVLAYNRLDSLSRCLRSLAAADYLSDTVHVHIYIDHFVKDRKVDELDRELGNSRKILEFVDGFEWKFGEKLVHYRTSNAGLQEQWLEAWWPGSDNEFAFVVEDDLEVSPLYYKFVRAVILNYYYNSSNYNPSVYGVTLQRPRFVPGKHGNKLELERGTRLFLYQLVGTWGQILFPRQWKEFRLWYDDHKSKDIKPILEGMVTTGWYKRLGEKIWTPWFIKFIHSRGYFNIYTNFLQERALSVSHRDVGVNYGKSAGPDSNLLDKNSLDFNLLEMQPLRNLKWYDFCFHEALPNRVVKAFNNLSSVLNSVQRNNTVVILSVYGVSEILIRNTLCNFERLNVQNYILIGPRSDLLLDLARRGHAIIDTDQFVLSLGDKRLTKHQTASIETVKATLSVAYAIKMCLELKYNAWVVGGNTIFANGNVFLESTDPAFDLYADKSLGLMFLRSSTSVKEMRMDSFMQKVELIMDSKDNVPSNHQDSYFVDIVLRLLEPKGIRIKSMQKSFGVDISSNIDQSSRGVGNNVLYWSAEMNLELIQKRLGELGLWFLDSDASCTAVTCHQS